MREYYSEDIDETACYGLALKIPKNIRQFYKSLDRLKVEDINKYEAFKNSCRLYNLSHTAGEKKQHL